MDFTKRLYYGNNFYNVLNKLKEKHHLIIPTVTDNNSVDIINRKIFYGSTALHKCIEYNDLELTIELINMGADLSIKNIDQYDALIWHVNMSKIQIVQLIIIYLYLLKH